MQILSLGDFSKRSSPLARKRIYRVKRKSWSQLARVTFIRRLRAARVLSITAAEAAAAKPLLPATAAAALRSDASSSPHNHHHEARRLCSALKGRRPQVRRGSRASDQHDRGLISKITAEIETCVALCTRRGPALTPSATRQQTACNGHADCDPQEANMAHHSHIHLSTAARIALSRCASRFASPPRHALRSRVAPALPTSMCRTAWHAACKLASSRTRYTPSSVRCWCRSTRSSRRRSNACK